MLIFNCLLFFAVFFTPSPVRAADQVIPDLADAIMSLQIVSGMTVPNARDVTNDGKIDMNDALYSLMAVVRTIWADPATELTIAETLEEETLMPRDTFVTGISAADEDALAQAVVEANEADLQSKMLYNSFYMAAESTPASTLLNRYRAMMKGFEIAEKKYDEIIIIHEQIEAADIRPSQQLSRSVLELNVDPKLQWYIDNYGKTTPAGNKIDVKAIAERNKISVQRAYSVLKTHYSVVAEKETAKAIQYEAAERTAEEIKTAADTANTALSFVAGGQAALGVFKAAQTMNTTVKMYQSGSIGYSTMDYILRTQEKNILQGAINGGFSIGDGIMGVLTSPAVADAFGPDGQANLNTAKTLWSGVSIAKGLAYDGYCLLSVKDAFTGKAKLVISNLTDFTKTTVDTTGHIISILQNPDGSVTQAVQIPENPFGESVKNDAVYRSLSPDNMLPNGSYVAKDENETETSFTVTASKVTTLLPNLSGDDLLLQESGEIKEVEPPPYEHCCGWDVDVTGLSVYDYDDELFYYKQKTWDGYGYVYEKHGPYYRWWDNSRSQLLLAECYYENTSHGSRTTWHVNGVKSNQTYYNMGKQEGLETSWWDNGLKREEGTWGTGEEQCREGLWTLWYNNGNLQEENYWVNGELHGPCTQWYDNGARKAEGQFTNWARSGVWIYYNDDDTCNYRYDYEKNVTLECEP
jgi:antitoxin component YwqK of YwqJK toxin-antitoxin module